MVITQNNPLAIRGIRRKVPSLAVPLANMVEEWGTRCDDYEQGCPACVAWKLFDKSWFIPTVDDVMKEQQNGI